MIGWTVVATAGSVVGVLGAAVVVAVHDHRRTHPHAGAIPPAHLTGAASGDALPMPVPPAPFPWSRALHHEAFLLLLIGLGVLALDHLVSAHAVPALVQAFTGASWPTPPSLNVRMQGWVLILGLQMVLVHALRQSFRDWRAARGARLGHTVHLLRDALPLLFMAGVGAWLG